MKPRHFWWLFETLEKRKPAGGASLTSDEMTKLREMVAAAKREHAKRVAG